MINHVLKRIISSEESPATIVRGLNKAEPYTVDGSRFVDDEGHLLSNVIVRLCTFSHFQPRATVVDDLSSCCGGRLIADGDHTSTRDEMGIR